MAKRNNKEFEKFIRFTLNNDPESKEKVQIPANFLVNQVEKILDETKFRIHKEYMEFIVLEYERVNNGVEIAKFNGMTQDELEKEKFKEKFLFELVEKLKKINSKY